MFSGVLEKSISTGLKIFRQGIEEIVCFELCAEWHVDISCFSVLYEV